MAARQAAETPHCGVVGTSHTGAGNTPLSVLDAAVSDRRDDFYRYAVSFLYNFISQILEQNP